MSEILTQVAGFDLKIMCKIGVLTSFLTGQEAV